MAETLESLQRRKETASELDSVVRTMKALAASNIGQYQTAVQSLKEYYRTVALGLYACLLHPPDTVEANRFPSHKEMETIALVFGSDQGLVGRFNDDLAEFVEQKLRPLPGNKQVWVMGERILPFLTEKGIGASKVFPLPNSVTGITDLVNQLLVTLEESREENRLHNLYLFHNAPVELGTMEVSMTHVLPLDMEWKKKMGIDRWPGPLVPQILGGGEKLLHALMREHLFMSLYKSCAESLASENASRLKAMERAEKNIGEMLEDLHRTYNRLRQSTIDEELFDVMAGFEALKTKNG